MCPHCVPLLSTGDSSGGEGGEDSGNDEDYVADADVEGMEEEDLPSGLGAGAACADNDDDVHMADDVLAEAAVHKP